MSLKQAYFKGTNVSKGTYTEAEKNNIREALKRFIRKRDLIVSKLKAYKKKKNLTTDELDKMGLYPHKLLDPIYRKITLQTSSGKGGGEIPDQEMLVIIERMLRKSNMNRSELDDLIVEYGGIENILAAESEIDRYREDMEDLVSRYVGQDTDTDEDIVMEGKEEPDEKDEKDEKEEINNIIKSRIEKVKNQKVKNAPTGRLRENEINVANITSLLQILASRSDRGIDRNILTLFNVSDMPQSDQTLFFVKLFSQMNPEEKNRVLKIFTRYGVDFSAKKKDFDPNKAYSEFHEGMTADNDDGLTMAQRRANAMLELRKLFHNKIDSKTFLKGNEISSNEVKIGNRRYNVNKILKFPKKELEYVQQDEILSPEQNVVDRSILEDDLLVINTELERNRLPINQSQIILDLLRSSFSRGTIQIYTDHGVEWSRAQELSYAAALTQITNMLTDSISNNNQTILNSTKIVELIRYIGKHIRNAPIGSSSNFRSNASIVMTDMMGNNQPPSVSETMNRSEQANRDMIFEEFKVPSISEIPGEDGVRARNLFGYMASIAATAGSAVRVRLFGQNFEIGVAQMSYSERVAHYNTLSRDELDKLARESYNMNTFLMSKEEIITEIIDRQPNAPISGGPDDPDPDRGVFVTINGVVRRIRFSYWISILLALGFTAKKIVDHINKLKEDKNTTLDIPPKKEDDKEKNTKDKKPDQEMPIDTVNRDNIDTPSYPYKPSNPNFKPSKRPPILGNNNDFIIPVDSRDNLDYTNISEDFLKDPLQGQLNQLNTPPPDPVLGAELINKDLVKDPKLLTQIFEYNDLANEYNKNIADYDYYMVEQKPKGIWGNVVNANEVNLGIANEMRLRTDVMKEYIEKGDKPMTGNQEKINVYSEFKPSSYIAPNSNYVNGYFRNFNKIQKSQLSKQLGLNGKIDEYNEAVDDYNTSVNKIVSDNPDKTKMKPLTKIEEQKMNNLQAKMRQIDDATKNYNASERIGRVESRQLEYTGLDKQIIDKIVNNSKIPLTDEEERSLRDDPELYKSAKEYYDQVNSPDSEDKDRKLYVIKSRFKRIQDNDYKPSSFYKPISEKYNVDYDENSEKVFMDSKTSYMNALNKFKNASISNAPRHMVNQLYQDMDNKKVDYETKRIKYENTVNEFRTGQTAQTTYLANMDNEVIPRTTEERKSFDRLQNIESILQTNPDALQMYNEQVSNMMKNQPALSKYATRMKILQTISSQYNLSSEYIIAANEDLNIHVRDDAEDTDANLGINNEDIGEATERANSIDPAEATLFLSSKMEAEAEQKRWAAYSNVQPFNGLGDTRTNPLLREQVRTYINQFATPNKCAYPTRNDMRMLNRNKIIKSQQLLPQVSNRPFIPTIQVAFGQDHFENEFSIPSMQGASAFTLEDNNLPNNNFSTFMNPNSIYQPDYQLMKYNTDLSSTKTSTGNSSRQSQYRFTDENQRPKYYTQTNLEYLGATMNNNYGSNPQVQTHNLENLNKPGAYENPRISIFNSNCMKKLGIKTRR
jgi:hypothetical protein